MNASATVTNPAAFSLRPVYVKISRTINEREDIRADLLRVSRMYHRNDPLAVVAQEELAKKLSAQVPGTENSREIRFLWRRNRGNPDLPILPKEVRVLGPAIAGCKEVNRARIHREPGSEFYAILIFLRHGTENSFPYAAEDGDPAELGIESNGRVILTTQYGRRPNVPELQISAGLLKNDALRIIKSIGNCWAQ